MLPVATREISTSDMESVESFFDTYETPYSVGTQLTMGSQFNTIAFEEGEEYVEFVAVPTNPTQTVKQEPVEVDYNAVFVDNAGNRAALLEPEEYEDVNFLPELRQAFHEGESFKEREADYRYHFPDGTTEVAVRASDPVDRLDEAVEIVAIEYIGGFAPQKWLLETSEGEGLYLRERSGSIKLYDSVEGEEQIFNAYIGGEHPGTPLYTKTDSEDSYNAEEDEVISIISSVNYINVVESPRASVSEEIRDQYDEHLGNMYEKTMEHNDRDFEELYEDLDFDQSEE